MISRNDLVINRASFFYYRAPWVPNIHPTLTYSRRSNEPPDLNTLICSRCKLKKCIFYIKNHGIKKKNSVSHSGRRAVGIIPLRHKIEAESDRLIFQHLNFLNFVLVLYWAIAPTPLAAVSYKPPILKYNYELFNCNKFNICYRSWNYRGCWHQTFPPIVTCSII